jgi:hypothetical protein
MVEALTAVLTPRLDFLRGALTGVSAGAGVGAAATLDDGAGFLLDVDGGGVDGGGVTSAGVVAAALTGADTAGVSATAAVDAMVAVVTTAVLTPRPDLLLAEPTGVEEAAGVETAR